MKKKYLRLIGLVWVLVLFLTSCSGRAVDSERLRVAMIPKVIGISYFDICVDGAKEAGLAYDMDIIYKGPTTADAASQVNIIQDMIFQNVDVLAVAPVDPDAVEPILLKAREKGIKVITYDADATIAGRDLFVNQVDSEVLGKHIIDNMVKLVGPDGNYAILTASMTADNQNQWLISMREYQEDMYPDLNLLTIIPTDEDQQKAYVNTRNLIQAYPELDGIFAMSTEAGPGAAQALKSLEIKGDIKLYCLSLPEDMAGYIRDGYVQLVTLWDPYDLGRLTIESLYYMLENELPTGNRINISGEEYVFDPDTGTIIMGQPLDFDQSNIDDIKFK